jgi:hypothetical protein
LWVLKNPKSIFIVSSMPLWTWIYRHTIHTWNSKSMLIWNDGNFWKPKFNFIWCNLWNKSKQGMPYLGMHNIIFIPILQYPLYILMVFDEWMTLEKVRKMIYTQFSKHYQNDSQSIGCPMLSLWTMCKLKSMSYLVKKCGFNNVLPIIVLVLQIKDFKYLHSYRPMLRDLYLWVWTW